MGDTLNGELAYIFLVSILDAAVLSWIALRWYRRSVSHLMRAPAGAADVGDEDIAVDLRDQIAADQLVLARVDGSAAARDAARRWPAGWRRIAAAYVAGAVVYGAVMALAWNAQMHSLTPAAIVTLVWAHMWPLVPALGLLLALDLKQTFGLLARFLVAGVVAVVTVTLAGQIVSGRFSTAPVTNVYWALLQLLAISYVPLTLLLLTGWRRIRAIVGFTLAATLVFGVALFAFRRLVIEAFNVGALKTAMLEFAAVTSTTTAYYAVYMVLALPVGWLVWRLLRGLAAAFERKAFSDLQLVVDCWIAVVTFEAMATHLIAPFGPAGLAVGLAAFGGYRATVEVILRRTPLPAAGTTAGQRDGSRLLLLRVFGYQTRTESLFDYIAQRWRFRGPVQLIAGSDLAMRTVDPGDALAFVTGKLRDRYVSSYEEVPDRMAQLDMRRDPDGRFRVNDLYCLHNTWKRTLDALLAISDLVVMDVRGFTRERKGILYELNQMIATIPTTRIVLVADSVTDLPLLEDILRQAWARTSASGLPRPDGPISVVNVERNKRRELHTVMTRLIDADGLPAAAAA